MQHQVRRAIAYKLAAAWYAGIEIILCELRTKISYTAAQKKHEKA